jgi:hypothetical protein
MPIRALPVTIVSTPFAPIYWKRREIMKLPSNTTGLRLQRTTSIPERNYLMTQAARLAVD